MKKFLKLAAAVTAVCLVLAFAAQVIGTTPYAAPEEFTSWPEFETFMAEKVLESYRREWEDAGFTVSVMPNGCLVKDSDGDLVDSIVFQTETITDRDGKVLATYAIGSAAHISFSFDKSEGGLPVRVWTQTALRAGYQRQQAVCTVLYLAAAAAWAVCAVLYLRRRKKG